MRHEVRSLVLLATALTTTHACQATPDPGMAPDLTRPEQESIPVLPTTLDRVVRNNGGLLAPTADGTSFDPAFVAEARTSYETASAPATFASWKQTFSFPARAPGEDLDGYRQRAGVVTYYNKNELGLGRELGCATFADDGGKTGIACYVTNYGATFGALGDSLARAIAGTVPRNTVAITYRPSLGPGYEVQFYTYDADGSRLDWAQLDSRGPRPHPHVCMGCHGGVYDSQRHLAKHARFLPLDPNVVVFAHDVATPASLTRAGLEERIRAVNALAVRTPLTTAQVEMLRELYAGQIDVPGAVSQPSWYPAGWQRPGHDVRDDQVFDRVLKPYCATCHLAIERGFDDLPVVTTNMLRSPEDARRFPLLGVVCGSFGMPNAQPTSNNFWSFPDGMLDGTGAPADALFAWLGTDRRSCVGLGDVATCNRGPDPDALCGNASSGAACDLTSGRCLPRPSLDPAALPAVRGYCQTQGPRTCPPTLTCVPQAPPSPGLQRFDGVCVSAG